MCETQTSLYIDLLYSMLYRRSMLLTSRACSNKTLREYLIQSRPKHCRNVGDVVDGWRGGLVAGSGTCDLVVAGSRPGRDAAA